jgi:hypothetical protein
VPTEAKAPRHGTSLRRVPACVHLVVMPACVHLVVMPACVRHMARSVTLTVPPRVCGGCVDGVSVC